MTARLRRPPLKVRTNRKCKDRVKVNAVQAPVSVTADVANVRLLHSRAPDRSSYSNPTGHSRLRQAKHREISNHHRQRARSRAAAHPDRVRIAHHHHLRRRNRHRAIVVNFRVLQQTASAAHVAGTAPAIRSTCGKDEE